MDNSKDILVKLQGIRWLKVNFDAILVDSEKKKIDEYELFLIEKLKTAIDTEMAER